MSEALRQALKVIDKHSISAIRTNSKDCGDWAEDMAYVGKVAREALAQPPAPTAQPDSEADELQALNDKLSSILSRTAVALRGPEPPLTRWSWHDLPERAAAAIAAIDVMQRAAQIAAQPVQQPGAEPDGRLHADGYFTWKRRDGYVLDAKLPCDFYLAAPAQRQPLSDEEIDSLTFPFLTAELGPTAYDRAIARAIEAAHNITAAPAAQKGEKL